MDREGVEVDRLVYALLNYRSPGSLELDEEFYLDRQDGDVLWVCDDAGVDEREFPSEYNRYEQIAPLEEAEVSLLTDKDIEDIADRFRRSRGFEGEDRPVP